MSPRQLFPLLAAIASAAPLFAHGTVITPVSRVYRVYQSNPESPNFALAQNAVAIDGTLSYYTWNEVSRNIPQAVQAGLPAGFDYSPWVPDGQLASGGRVDPSSPEYPRTYAGLDQASADWPTTPVVGGSNLSVDFLATAVHEPSVWDVWMTTADWDPSSALNWAQMEFLGRPQPNLVGNHYFFDVAIPTDRTGHHVLWVAWHRNDSVGEVFFSTSDLMIEAPAGPGTNFCSAAPNSVSAGGAQISASGSASVAANDLTLLAGPLPQGQPGIFYHGALQANAPFGDGLRCVANSLVRVPPASTPDQSGVLSSALDNTALGGAGIFVGSTRHFQAWYRDPAGGPNGFNLSDGLSITFVL